MSAFTATTVTAQERGNSEARPSPNASVSQTFGTTVVSVTYGRPSLRDRDVQTLIHDRANGEVWRTGANEATTITFSTDVVFGGQEVKAGTYTLFSLPKDEWTFILSKKLLRQTRDGGTAPLWGTQYDAAEDAARTSVAINTTSDSKELFTIYFDTVSNEKAHLNMTWGNVHVAVPISAK